MRVAFVVERKNYYRLLGPVVDAALARGWEVVCFHDYAQPRSGMKGYEFPSVDAVPAFRHGSPRIETYRGEDSLCESIRAAGVDAVLSIMPPPAAIDSGSLGAKWIGLQYAAELLYHLLSPRFGVVSLLGFYSPWWLEFGLQVLRLRGLTAPGDALEEEIRRKSAVIGFPEVDQFREIDPTEVRRRWGIPPGKPVVALLPYPFRSNPRTAWSRWVYAAGSGVWKRMRLRFAGEKSLEPLVSLGRDDVAVTRAVRAFCDANGAYLLVKARVKDPLPRYLRRISDLTLNDQAHYPPTILEVLAVADLCVHFYSGTVLEAVACGVPSLSICPGLDEMGATADWQRLVYTRQEGSLFQFRGVAETIEVGDAIERLPKTHLSDFATDPRARKAYVAKFLGFDDGRSAGRLLDATRGLVEEARP